jgi:hypothetical protein
MKSLINITSIILSANYANAQKDTINFDNFEKAPARSTLTLGTVYSNNASYYGQRSEENTPYVAIAANYQLKSGFYLTGQTFKLLNDQSSTLSAASLGAGINFKLGERLAADISYSRSFFPSHSPLLQAGSADNASMTISHNSWIKTNLTGDYAFGKVNDAFATGEIEKDINLFSIGKKDLVSITPSASIIAGTQHFYQTYKAEKKMRDSILGIITDPIFGPPSGPQEDKLVEKTSFNVLSYNLKLPIAYNRVNYLIEAAYQFSYLSKYAASDKSQVISFLTFSFYYQF